RLRPIREERWNRRRISSPAKQESLTAVASLLEQILRLGAGFDPLRHNLHAQAGAQLDHRIHDGGPSALQVTNEALVDLYGIDRIFRQMAEGGIACAEIIESNADAGGAQ